MMSHDPPSLCEALPSLSGHADTASTERYAHLADSHVRAAAGRISGIVHDAMTGSTEEAGHEQ